MKKLFLLFSMMALAFNASAQNYLTVDNLTVRPGKTATLVIGYHFNELPEGQRMAGYQVDIKCPEGVTINLTSTTLGEGYYDDGYALMSNRPSDNVYRLVGFPMPINGQMTCIKGTEGVLLNIPVTISDDVQSGTVFDCIIEGIIFSTSGSMQINDFADVPFTITVDDNMVEQVIDENATVAPQAMSGTNVKVIRTIKANEWSTICLPFNMDADQLKAAFGDGVSLADFTDWEVVAEDDYIYQVNIMFSPVNALEAHHPYIIKTTKDVSEFLALGVDVTEEDDIVTEVKHSRKEVSEMVGTYVAGTPVPEFSLFLSGNKFWYSNGNTTMKGLRAYFDIYDVLSKVEDAGAKVNIVFDGDATGIANVEKQATNDKIYSVGGQYMGTDASRLQRGVYIMNGKKVVKK